MICDCHVNYLRVLAVCFIRYHAIGFCQCHALSHSNSVRLCFFVSLPGTLKSGSFIIQNKQRFFTPKQNRMKCVFVLKYDCLALVIFTKTNIWLAVMNSIWTVYDCILYLRYMIRTQQWINLIYERLASFWNDIGKSWRTKPGGSYMSLLIWFFSICS